MQKFNYISRDMDTPELIDLPHGKVIIYTRSSPLKSSGNEDSAAIISMNAETSLLVVADGMGGHANGAAASALLIQMLEDAFTASDPDDTSLREIILNTLEEANSSLLQNESGGGTTIAIAEINNDFIRTYHVGDSEIIVTGQKGKLKLQTLSHSPTAYALESGLIDEDQAIGHEDRHFITNYVGQADMPIAIGSSVSLRSRDTVLLGSDGLFDNLFKDEIIEIIRKGDLEKNAHTLMELTTKRMQEKQEKLPSKPDDLSYILYRSK